MIQQITDGSNTCFAQKVLISDDSNEWEYTKKEYIYTLYSQCH